MTTNQAVDPAVSRAKFDGEIQDFRNLEDEYGQRGWFLVSAEFPRALVVLAARQLKPPAIVTGVAFDYTDYDLRPPSVRLVDPFTQAPWTAEDLPTTLRRRVETDGGLPFGLQLPLGASIPRLIQEQPLMQSYTGETPFLCVAGVREYHDHPAHSGDTWELHRPMGAGRLVRLLEVISTYGLRPISGYNVSLVPQIVGFVQTEPPL